MPDNKRFGDDPVDHYIEKEDSVWRALILENPTYTTTDGKEYDNREDARDHQRYVNKKESE
jgi:hypothetical protein